MFYAGGSDEDSEGDNVGKRKDHVTIKAQQMVLEEEKKSLMQNNELLKEVSVKIASPAISVMVICVQEREKLLSEVQHREELLKKEQKKRDQLNSKIKAMESKLLAGNVLDRSDETKKALEAKKQEVIEQRV